MKQAFIIVIALALMIIGFGIQILIFKSWCHKGSCDIQTVSRDGKEIRRIH